MAFKVQVGPPQIAIHQGQSVLLTEPDGQVNSPSNRGLYFRDTRVISAWAIYANGEPWDLLNGGAIAHYAARTSRLIAPTATASSEPHAGPGDRPQSRADCTRISTSPTTAHSGALQPGDRDPRDFADIFEVKSGSIVRRGRITTSWSDKRQVLRITYRNRDFCREVIVRTGEGDGEPAVNANGRLSFDIALKAGQAWHRCLIYDLVDGGEAHLARRGNAPIPARHRTMPARWTNGSARC